MNFPQHIGKALTVEEKSTFQKVRACKRRRFKQVTIQKKREPRRRSLLYREGSSQEEPRRSLATVLYEAVGERTQKVYFASYSHAEVSKWLSQFCLMKDERLAYPVHKLQRVNFPETIKIKRSYK